MLVGMVISPRCSPIIMSGYVRTLEEAVASLHRHDLALHISRDWHMQPSFLQALADECDKRWIACHPTCANVSLSCSLHTVCRNE